MKEKFRVDSIERGNRFDGTSSYTLRGWDARGNHEAFSVPCRLFPLLEGVLGREPGTAIMVAREQGRVTEIKIVTLARKIDNHKARKQNRGGRVLHF